MCLKHVSEMLKQGGDNGGAGAMKTWFVRPLICASLNGLTQAAWVSSLETKKEPKIAALMETLEEKVPSKVGQIEAHKFYTDNLLKIAGKDIR